MHPLISCLFSLYSTSVFRLQLQRQSPDTRAQELEQIAPMDITRASDGLADTRRCAWTPSGSTLGRRWNPVRRDSLDITAQRSAFISFYQDMSIRRPHSRPPLLPFKPLSSSPFLAFKSLIHLSLVAQHQQSLSPNHNPSQPPTLENSLPLSCFATVLDTVFSSLLAPWVSSFDSLAYRLP